MFSATFIFSSYYIRKTVGTRELVGWQRGGPQLAANVAMAMAGGRSEIR